MVSPWDSAGSKRAPYSALLEWKAARLAQAPSTTRGLSHWSREPRFGLSCRGAQPRPKRLLPHWPRRLSVSPSSPSLISVNYLVLHLGHVFLQTRHSAPLHIQSKNQNNSTVQFGTIRVWLENRLSFCTMMINEYTLWGALDFFLIMFKNTLGYFKAL